MTWMIRRLLTALSFRAGPTTFALVIALVYTAAPSQASAQESTRAVTLNDAVQLALTNYPAIKERRARAQAANEGIALARTTYLPRVDATWQENRATTNNVFGLLFPQAIVPPISGPVLGTRSYETVWGSAAGVLLTWDAVDFGQRKAAVDTARAQSSLATAQASLTTLDVASAAADAFLTVLAADEAVRAARANVARLRVFGDSVRTLVQNQLRPGADQSRAEAELALAQNQLTQAEFAAELARASLAETVGAAGAAIEPSNAALGLPRDVDIDPFVAQAHPAAQIAEASVNVVRARERALARAYYPRLSFQSAFAGRGTGAELPGQASLGSGAWLQVPNWAVGASLTFSAFEIFPINAKKRVELQQEIAETARQAQTLQTLTTQDMRARALLKAARAIAGNMPVARQAAVEAESRARVRYQNGLANITEVAESQRLLAQAEADDGLARLGVWRALLAVAQARGDLKPFLEQTARP
jgi:outer membrane protein